MADELLNRLTRLERLLRAGFTTAKLVITGLATLGGLRVSGEAAFGPGAQTSGASGDAYFGRSGGSMLSVQTPSGQVRVFANSSNELWLGAGGTADLIRVGTTGGLHIPDGIAAPSTVTGKAIIYVDTADGDLKVKFGDGTVKTIVIDT